jgi:hypothetical protein
MVTYLGKTYIGYKLITDGSVLKIMEFQMSLTTTYVQFNTYCNMVQITKINEEILRRKDLHVRPSVRIYQRGSHWMDFREI